GDVASNRGQAVVTRDGVVDIEEAESRIFGQHDDVVAASRLTTTLHSVSVRCRDRVAEGAVGSAGPTGRCRNDDPALTEACHHRLVTRHLDKPHRVPAGTGPVPTNELAA